MIKEKHIFLSDVNDKQFFDKYFGLYKYLIYDKYQTLKNLKFPRSFLGLEKNHVRRFIFNNKAEEEFIEKLKNKKYENIIYLLYKSEPEDIIENIQNNIIPKFNGLYNITISIITEEDYYEDDYYHENLINIKIIKPSDVIFNNNKQ
jgi:hypothetical protein